MSRTTEPMQYLLDLLTTGLLTSASQQLGKTPIANPPDSDFPLVEAFGPTIATPTADLVQSHGVLTFFLTITDVAKTHATKTQNDLQQLGDRLASSLSVDSTLRGLVEHCYIANREILEVADENNLVATFTVVCELAEEQRTELIRLAPFEDVSKFVSVVQGGAIEQSAVIPRAVGFKRGTDIFARVRWDQVTDPASFPSGRLDLTVTNFVRCVFYQNREASDATVNFEIRIGDYNGGSPLVDYRRYLQPRSFHGPQEIVFDLLSPFAVVGTPGGLDSVEAVSFVSANFFAPATTTFGMIFMEFGYTARDIFQTGGHGVEPGL